MTPETRSVVLAALLGAAFAAVVIVAMSGGLIDRMTIGDGEIYTYVAAHFDTPPELVHPVVSSRGTSLRYGRVGLPGILWLLSFGQPVAMPYVQPLIMIASGAAIAGAIRVLFPQLPLAWTLLPFIAVGVTLALAGGFAEAPAAAIGLWAVVAATRERWWWTTVALAVALLTRENAGAILVGVALWASMNRRIRVVPILATSLLPLLAWYLVVDARYGAIPILDPYLRITTDTIGPPFVAVWQSLTQSPLDSTVAAAVHVALALAAFTLWRSSLLGAIAASAALQVVSAGPFAWHFAGEAVRTGAFLQLFLVLALLQRFQGGRVFLPSTAKV